MEDYNLTSWNEKQLKLRWKKSCCAASMDLSDPLLPPVSSVHCFQEVFKAISCIGIEQLNIGSSWSSCVCSSMWRGPLEYVAYEWKKYLYKNNSSWLWMLLIENEEKNVSGQEPMQRLLRKYIIAYKNVEHRVVVISHQG